MSKYSLRRVLSFLLAVMMVCTLLPTAAFAEEGVEQPAAGEQTAATPDGENVPEVQNEPAEESLNLTGAPVVLDAPQPNSTVWLHPADGYVPTGVKVAVGDKINGYTVSKIDGKDITVDLGKYNVNNDSFRLPLPEEIWVGVKMQYGTNQTYVSWAGSGSSHKAPGSSALLANGTNTAYYYYLGKDDGTSANVWNFTLKYDANGGTGAPADQTYGTADKYEKSHSFTIPTGVPTRDGYTFKGWSDTNGGAAAYQPGGTCHVVQTADGYNGGSVTKTLYAVWEAEAPSKPQKPTEEQITSALDNPAVILHCTRQNQDSSYQFGYVPNTKYDVTEPKLENGSYTCILTIYADGYVSWINEAIPHLTHTLNDTESKTVKLTYDSTGRKWTASPGSVTFNVSCPAPRPTAPSGIEFYDKFDVYVVCDTESTAHPAKKIALQPRSFTVGTVEGNETDGYTCTVTVTADAYVRIFRDYYHDSSHALVPTEKSTKTFILKWVGDEWKLPDDLDITFHVKCVPYCFVYYKDGVAEEAFENQVTRVAMGDPTPAFEGTPTREGYDFAGWDPEVAPTVTEYYTYYTAVWEAEGPSKPEKPTDDFLQKLGSSPVRLSCTTNSTNHNYYPSNMLSGSYKTGDVTEVNGIYTCTVTVYAQKYVDAFNKYNTVQHELDDVASKSFTLTYNAENKTWEVLSGNLPIRFSMKCPPQQPTIDTIKARNWKVGITCVDKKDTHVINHLYLEEGDFTVGEMKQDEDGSYICEITVKAEKYIEEFYKSYYVSHTFHKLVDGEPSEKTFTARFVSGNWVADDPVVTFKVTCDFMPEKPDIETLLQENKAVGIDCVTEGSNHKREYFKLIDGSYTVTDPERDDTGARVCFVTVDAAPYLTEYAKSNGAHKPASAEESRKTYRVWFNATSGKWVITLPDWTFIRFAAVCDNTPIPPNKPTNAEAEGLIPKNAIKVSCLHSAHKSFSTLDLKDGEYEILGVTQENGDYYCTIKLDPLSYVSISPIAYHKLDPKDQNPTIQLRYDTATEKWTVSTSLPVNITVMCDYTVTYTDGVGGTAFADQVYSGLKHKDPTPEFNGTPTRQGYIFDGWSPAVGKLVFWSDTYTAKWKLDAPAAPSEEDINTLLNGKVRIECTGIHTAKTKGLIPGTYTTGSVVHDDDSGFTCTITITNLDAYVSDYSNATGETHTLSSVTPQDAAVTLKYVDDKWTLPGDGITITTSCSAFPKAPTEQEVENTFAFHIRINLKCSTIKAFYACYLNEGNYRIGSVTKEGSDFYCTLEFDLPSYVAANSSTFLCSSGPHRLVPENQNNTIKLKYAKDLYAKWLIDGDDEIDVTVSCAYTVTYTDGVDGEEIFPDETADVIYGKATPAFTGGTPKRTGYVFAGWNPAVADKVTEDVTYTATWKEDFNNNGKPDDEEERFTVTYTDGVKGKAFKDQVYDNLLSGTDTPEFSGKPTRKGYTFAGWSPKVADTVTKDVTYTATWKAVNTSGKDKLAKTGDNGLVLVFGGLMLLSLCGAAAVCVIDRKRRHS